jgi:hypothetical protein
MERILSLLVLGLYSAGCASAPIEAAEQTPLSLTVPVRAGETEIKTIDRQTRSLELRVLSRKSKKAEPLTRQLQIDPEFIPRSSARLTARLEGLPIEIKTRNLHENLWEIEISQNLMLLLSKDSKRSTYVGELVLDTLGRSIPLKVTFERGDTERRSVKSAG